MNLVGGVKPLGGVEFLIKNMKSERQKLRNRIQGIRWGGSEAVGGGPNLARSDCSIRETQGGTTISVSDSARVDPGTDSEESVGGGPDPLGGVEISRNLAGGISETDLPPPTISGHLKYNLLH